MASVSLRPAAADEAPLLRELVRDSYQHYVPRIGREPVPMTYDYDEVLREWGVTVAERADEVVGLVVTGEADEGFVVDNLAVRPDHRGAGVGRALLVHAEDLAREAGFDSIYLYTHELMTENIALYERIGYVEYARRFKGDANVVYLRKTLPAHRR